MSLCRGVDELHRGAPQRTLPKARDLRALSTHRQPIVATVDPAVDNGGDHALRFALLCLGEPRAQVDFAGGNHHIWIQALTAIPTPVIPDGIAPIRFAECADLPRD